MDLSTLFLQRDARSRSLSAENPRGEKGQGGRATAETSLHPPSAHAARELGPGWKLSPCLRVGAGETVILMDHDGPGVIRHLWWTLNAAFYRDAVIRMYWDDQSAPSVECPVGDFMACSWNARQRILALPVNVNPNGGMNCFLPMPFRRHARITLTNESAVELPAFYYTIDYTLEEVPDKALYFHARWRRSNPLPAGADFTILDGVKGRGHYVGVFMSWQQNNADWWGEGELKCFIDGDDRHPTICGTGTEDYFGGAWNFGKESFSAPFFGFQQVAGESERAGTRMTLYRFHVPDPIHFATDLRVTMQALGWRKEGRFLPLQDDIACVAYWYQTLPHVPFPPFPDRNAREIV